MVLWTIHVVQINGSLHGIEIDNNETFGTLRRKVAEEMKIPNNDLILVVGDLEYS